MKKIVLLCALVLGAAPALFAQSVYDAENFMNRDLSGTSRFVGMGGALGALGADISTMGINPAGIGLYRRYDFAGTLGFSINEFEAKYQNYSGKTTRNKFNLGQLGVVISSDIQGEVLKYVNFGFNYKRSKNFNRSFKVDAPLNLGPNGEIVSMANIMASQANQFGPNFGNTVSNDNFPYSNPNLGWLSILGYEGLAIVADENGKYQMNPEIDRAPGLLFEQRESGGIDQYDFNVAFNLANRVFIGATLGVSDINHRIDSYYDESYKNTPPDAGGIVDKQYMVLNTYTETDGTGFDFKLGTIIRPIESSPFRIGLAVHTPTFYKLTKYMGAIIESQIVDPSSGNLKSGATNTYDSNGREYAYDYQLRTPWVYNVSLGHSIGSFASFGAEYEYQDYSSVKFKEDNGDDMSFQNSMRGMLKGVHTLRLGTEIKLAPEFAMRLGYNYQTSTTSKEAYLDFPINSTQTDIQYINNDSHRNTFTMGVGYMGKVCYADLAFKFDQYKSSFAPFKDEFLKPTRLTTDRSSVLFTFGVRL